MPNMLVFRPATAMRPAVLTRWPSRTASAPAPLPQPPRHGQPGELIDRQGGPGWLRREDCAGTPWDLILIGTGTELDLCVQAAKQLTAEGKKVRVVSMPCVELFDEQTDAYKEEVLPNAVRKRMVVEVLNPLAGTVSLARWR